MLLISVRSIQSRTPIHGRCHPLLRWVPTSVNPVQKFPHRHEQSFCLLDESKSCQTGNHVNHLPSVPDSTHGSRLLFLKKLLHEPFGGSHHTLKNKPLWNQSPGNSVVSFLPFPLRFTGTQPHTLPTALASQMLIKHRDPVLCRVHPESRLELADDSPAV